VDVSTRFCSRPQNQNDASLVARKLPKFYQFHGMAAVVAGFESVGLLRVGNFGGKGQRETASQHRLAETKTDIGMESFTNGKGACRD
jgi:hypothetical protein